MIKKCKGCGIKLQSEDSLKEGYINKEKISNGYCKRCFRLINYKEIPEEIHRADNTQIIKKLNGKQGFCFFICDILNFNKETFSYYKKIKLDKCLVVSKKDLIPKDINFISLKEWLKNEGINEEIIFVSSLKGYGTQMLLEKIKEEHEKNIFFVGMSNAGKSNLLNNLFATKLTVSSMPNTTKDFISFKYLDKVIYDSVGFTYENDFDYLKYNFAHAKDIIKVRNMPVKKGGSIYLDKILRLECLSDCDVVCYFSKNLDIKKIYENNKIYLDEEKVEIEIFDSSNIMIKGVGFFYIKKRAKFRLYHLDKKMIEVSNSFFGK